MASKTCLFLALALVVSSCSIALDVGVELGAVDVVHAQRELLRRSRWPRPGRGHWAAAAPPETGFSGSLVGVGEPEGEVAAGHERQHEHGDQDGGEHGAHVRRPPAARAGAVVWSGSSIPRSCEDKRLYSWSSAIDGESSIHFQESDPNSWAAPPS